MSTYPSNCMKIHHPKDPCIIYLPFFTYIWVHLDGTCKSMPYMDPMVHSDGIKYRSPGANN